MLSVRFIRRMVAWIFAFVFFYAVLFLEDQSPRTPRVPPAIPDGEVGRTLPVPNFDDPSISITIEGQVEPGLGSGFSVHESGVWLTARHVVDSCAVIALVKDGDAPVFVRHVTVHPSADVAVLRAALRAPPLNMSSEPLTFGEPGAHFGYPQGYARQVHTTLIGRRKMLTHGRYRIREPVIAWAENVRLPEFKGTLGGLSGGMVMSEHGDVVGLTVASSIRRGRVFTADPSSLFGALRLAQRNAADEGTVLFDEDAFERRNLRSTGKRLRKTGTLVRVLCLIEPLAGM